MISVNFDECEAAGLDIKKVKSIARRLSKALLEANALGMEGFGSGEFTLRYKDYEDKGDLIIANLDGVCDGGAGDQADYGDDLIRGEM